MAQYTGKHDDEVFVGNCDEYPEHLASFKTLRLGDVALDIDGKRLPPTYKAIFIGRSEEDAYDRLMVARLRAIRPGYAA